MLAVTSGAPPAERRLTEDHLALGSEAQGGLVIRNPTVSRRHALIRRQADGRGWEILDLHSTNGTFVNGQRVESAAPVNVGDRITLGAVALELRALAAAPGSSARPTRSERRRYGQRPLRLVAVALALSACALFAYVELRPTATSKAPAAPSPARPAALSSPYAAASSSAYPVAPAAAFPSRATAGAVATAPEPWLKRINFFRGLAKLKPLANDPALSHGDYDHARYLVENFAELIRRNDALGPLMHTESPDKPWYTPQGLKAAQSSDVEQWYDSQPAARRKKINPVDDWMRGPFHRLSILDSGLSEAGYGVYCESGVCASALELPHSWRAGAAPAGPVMFPPPGAAIPFSRTITGEWPNPLASCRGYHLPAGLPLTLQLGTFVPAVLSAHALALSGAPVEHCAFDAASYANPNPADQEWARNVLAAYGAIVLIPRAPLRRGVAYAVSITANGQNYDWSFTVSGPQGR